MKLKESNMSDTWYKGEPNGGRGENCAIMVKDATYDNPCESQHCGICDSPISPVFHMRGLCQKSNFDTEYSWTGEYSDEQAKKYTFVGVKSEGFLSWDESQKYWKLENIKDKTIFAVLNKTENSYPFGHHFWYVFNDDCQNGGVEVAPNTYKTELSFGACKDDTFNCHDGTWYVTDLINNSLKIWLFQTFISAPILHSDAMVNQTALIFLMKWNVNLLRS